MIRTPANDIHIRFEQAPTLDFCRAFEEGKGRLCDGWVEHHGQDERRHDEPRLQRRLIKVGLAFAAVAATTTSIPIPCAVDRFVTKGSALDEPIVYTASRAGRIGTGARERYAPVSVSGFLAIRVLMWCSRFARDSPRVHDPKHSKPDDEKRWDDKAKKSLCRKH